MPMSVQERTRQLMLYGRVFCPSTPVDRLDLFAGRTREIEKILSVVNNRGRHAIMYGDRGIGETSLANILKEIFSGI